MAYVDELHFVVEGDPVGKGRPRFTRSGHVFTPQKTRAATFLRHRRREATKAG